MKTVHRNLRITSDKSVWLDGALKAINHIFESYMRWRIYTTLLFFEKLPRSCEATWASLQTGMNTPDRMTAPFSVPDCPCYRVIPKHVCLLQLCYSCAKSR
ncbi:hypothetical protein RRG08_062145 [Elysia crispata]|uniref:Uncharacterized protein n=1 Tax=Elysia crispata TaxID=231223 RepID=A0AAE0YNH8_9GAST|nr:hypothetical protein RRG08_062145 [Elysia crispata]